MLPIVYVHLGNRSAPHLIDSILQSRIASPSSRIFVALSDNTVMADAAAAAGATVVNAERLSKTPQHRRYIDSVRRRLGKKRGFWRFATERFFVIEELMTAMNLPAALHLESDNLIFFDAAEIAPGLRIVFGDSLAAPFWNASRCVPGIVSIGSQDALGRLTAFIAERVAEERRRAARWYIPPMFNRVRMGIATDDMRLLADFRRASPAYIDVLPMVPDDHPSAGAVGRGFAELGMIFDGNTFGVHLFGLDQAQHAPGYDMKAFDAESHLDAPEFGYEQFQLPGSPFLTYRGRTVRLGSIHNHSKRPILPQ